MKKSDLKTGMIVTTREGKERIVFLRTSHGDVFVNSTEPVWSSLNNYDDDLISSCSQGLDIMKIETTNVFDFGSFNATREVLWKRPEPIKEMTMEDLEKHFGCKVKIIKAE